MFKKLIIVSVGVWQTLLEFEDPKQSLWSGKKGLREKLKRVPASEDDMVMNERKGKGLQPSWALRSRLIKAYLLSRFSYIVEAWR